VLSKLALLEPLIGVSWQYGFAKLCNVELSLSHALLLGLALWLTYMADRWLDAHRYKNTHSTRHAFARRHRNRIAATWLLVCTACVVLAAFTLDWRGWQRSLALLLATAGYFACLQHPRGAACKEVLVTLIYTCGVLAFVAPPLAKWSAGLWGATFGFAAIVLLNLTVIAAAERNLDAQQGGGSLGVRFSNLERFNSVFAALLCAGCLLTGGLSLLWSGRSLGVWFLALSAASGGLLALNGCVLTWDKDTLHVAADATLLAAAAPLFF
jgi:hypothetical protein